MSQSGKIQITRGRVFPDRYEVIHYSWLDHSHPSIMHMHKCTKRRNSINYHWSQVGLLRMHTCMCSLTTTAPEGSHSRWHACKHTFNTQAS